MNLIPEQPGRSPNYWCTWIAQKPEWYARTEAEYAACSSRPVIEGTNRVRDFLDQKAVFEDPGWAARAWAEVRSDLFFCFDDGWDVPTGIDANRENWRFGSLVVDAARFPACTGSPVERLTRLNERIRSLGWRGSALWVAAQCEGDGKDGKLLDDAACERHWRERLAWSAQAGIRYWKVDWGKRAFDGAFRRRLTAWARRDAPDLIVEHARVMGPLNNVAGNCRFAGYQGELTDSRDYLSFSDVFRSYDEIDELRVPTALDRIGTWLLRGHVKPPALGIVNAEDNVYLAAALGLSMGIMRVPVRGPHSQWLWPRLDEAVRAVRWQRLAPAFGVVAGDATLSEATLCDTHTIPANHWFREAAGRDIPQSAAAVIGRGLPLPVVHTEGEPPYVVASRNPNGASSVATLPRCRNGKPSLPLCDVELTAGSPRAPVGIFGRYRSLSIRFEQLIGAGRVWAQDLKADGAHDITRRVTIRDNLLVMPGTVIDEIGLSARTELDPSDPGLVVGLG